MEVILECVMGKEKEAMCSLESFFAISYYLFDSCL